MQIENEVYDHNKGKKEKALRVLLSTLRQADVNDYSVIDKDISIGNIKA